MYREFQAVMAQIIKHDREKTSLYTAVNELNADLEKEICEAFALHYEQIAERRKKFEKLFPKSRGNRWQKPLPNNKRELLYCFSDCMQSYFKLDKLSSITEPQEWASAMLDVLMLIGGAPCAQDLEKEFDEEIESLEKSIPEQ
jgi:hypothetical protein